MPKMLKRLSKPLHTSISRKMRRMMTQTTTRKTLSTLKSKKLRTVFILSTRELRLMVQSWMSKCSWNWPATFLSTTWRPLLSWALAKVSSLVITRERAKTTMTIPWRFLSCWRWVTGRSWSTKVKSLTKVPSNDSSTFRRAMLTLANNQISKRNDKAGMSRSSRKPMAASVSSLKKGNDL